MNSIRPIQVCLFIDYGQPAAEKEWEAVQAICDEARVLSDKISVPLMLGQMKKGEGPQIVPVRNAVLATIAANYAAACEIEFVLIGAARIDREDYADCRHEYISQLSAITEPFGVKVVAPLVHQDITREEAQAAVAHLPTWSCYAGGETPCGVCNSCTQVENARSSELSGIAR